MATIKLEGVDDLRRELEAKAKEYRTEIERAVSDAAEAVKEDWRSDVPVDEGDYRDSIGVKQDGMTAEVANFGREGRHGQYIEFGTSSRRARPSAAPAAERERTRLPDRIRDAIK